MHRAVQVPNRINGGMTIYYTLQDFNLNGDLKITASLPIRIPYQFHMVIGNPTANGKVSNDLKFVCLADKGTRFPELDVFPTSKSRAGIMTVYHFPAEAFNNGGSCPASHPVRIPQVAYGTLWDTTQFDNMGPSNGQNLRANGWISRLPGSGQVDPVPVPVPVTTSTRAQPPVVTQPAPGGTVPRYGQCGGQGCTSPTQCASPYTCKATNQYYSQCM
ncbi:hypothetical protein FA15DRAFT_709476 [Coprinopsis marcescibilis]|uniref:CBM1 domain-containing protein n=1 Tax=Coprinopsis marcescibilis TaxID=230819 RepID=A0A5C3KFK1_COPMA|nr:hypothetical protein FA15DRAFT_709476 [Coprinopsis marcescibilis]